MDGDKCINGDLKELMKTGDIYLDSGTGLPYMVVDGMRTVIFASLRDLIGAKEELQG